MVNLESSDGSANVSSVFSVSSGEYFRLDFWYFGNNDLGASVDSILVEWATPEITVGSSITGLDYIIGNGPSTSQSTTVSGSYLDGDITVSAPTNFEISTDNTNFSDSVTLGESGGTVSSTTIHARLNSGLSVDSYSGNITASLPMHQVKLLHYQVRSRLDYFCVQLLLDLIMQVVLVHQHNQPQLLVLIWVVLLWLLLQILKYQLIIFFCRLCCFVTQ